MVSYAKNRYFMLFSLAFIILLSAVQHAGAATGDPLGSNGSVENLNTGQYFSTIQAAVDAANEGATIVVFPGTHTENVDVYRSLTIRSYSGNPSDTVIRAASSADHVFYVTANNVKISGLTISGASQSAPYSGLYLYGAKSCTLENNIISGNWYGISLDGSSSDILNSNIVSSNLGTGIYLRNSAGNKLTGNTFSYNGEIGIWLKDSSNSNTLTGNTANSNFKSGFLLDNQCIGNVLSDNKIEANGEHGMYLNSASNSNTLKNNTINSNTIYGIYLSASGNNQVTDNNRIINNGGCGISLINSNYNRIFSNYFNNAQNTYFEGTNAGNLWNTTKTEQVNIVGGPYLGGNFWAKPDGTGLSQVNRDLTGDGFLDAEYDLTDINAAARNVDYLPLARTEIVDPSGKKGYTRIQDAVNAADNGYSIAVYPGTYRENLDLTKEVAIAALSGSPDNTIVTASDPNSHVFNLHSSGTVISGFSISGSTGSDSTSGIYLDSISACILSNNHVSGNSIGICLSNSGSNTLLNNKISSNKYDFKDSGTLENTIDTSNTVRGKPIYYLCSKSDLEIGSSSNAGTVHCINCNNITIKNLTFENNARGISFYNTGNSRILNNIIQNNFDGIYLESSYGNTLDSNTVNKSVNNGIFLSGSPTNTIINNRITENGVYGIGFSSSSSNLIYNNYFNSVNNVNVGADSTGNMWSTTKTAGTNIVGGPMLGGNYWATPQGTGFSQTCTDVGDDLICRQSFSIGQNNIDSLPLYNPAQVQPLVDFSANVTGGLAPLPVSFSVSASSRALPLIVSWNFGDGTPVLQGQNNIDGIYSGTMEHTFNNSGIFNVTLTASNGKGNASKTVQVYVAKPIVSSLSIGKYVVSLDENTKEIVINPGYGNVDVVDNAVLIRLTGVDLYIVSENGFEKDQNGYLKGKYQYATLYKTLESKDLGNGLTASFSFSANLNGQLSEFLSSDAGITCGIVPGTSSSNIEQAFKDSLATSSLYLNKPAYSLILEKNGLNGIDISDVNIVMSAPSEYINVNGGSDKFTIMSWHNGGAEKLSTTGNTDNSTFEFTGLSSTGFSSDSSFVASLLSLTSASNDGSVESNGDSSSSGDGSSSSGGSLSDSGSGVLSPEASDNIDVKEISQQFVISGSHIIFGFPKGATCVDSLEFDARKSFGKVSTSVEMLKGKSSLVKALPAGKVYKNFNIWVGSGGIITPQTIENASVEFKVDKKWVRDNIVDLTAITLNRYNGGSWSALPTSPVKVDGDYYYFKARTPEFASFSITESEDKIQTAEIVPFREVSKTVVQADQAANKVPQISGQVTKNETASSSGYGNPVILAVSALLLVLLCASPLAFPQVRDKVRDKVENKIRDLLYGDLEFSESEEDKKGKSLEIENEEVTDQEAIIDVSAEEAQEREKRAREKITAEKERTSYRAFLSELQKSKNQEEGEEE
ncbi:MAG: trimeric autotransporter adhesin [Euryarchaeota archaeon]|nr:trimeric autotransporter adhesin [Euryarchaeota archaeon]